jgi:hypothetical protein
MKSSFDGAGWPITGALINKASVAKIDPDFMHSPETGPAQAIGGRRPLVNLRLSCLIRRR